MIAPEIVARGTRQRVDEDMKQYPHIYARWQDVPAAAFSKRWPNFSPREIACKGTGKVAINFAAMDKLQELRTYLGRPIILNSAYRSPEHNRAVGGAKSSKHMLAQAFDARQENQDPHEYQKAARAVGFLGFGTYPQSNFIHVDIGPARAWGKPFPKTVTSLPIEIPVPKDTPKPGPFAALIQAILKLFGGLNR